MFCSLLVDPHNLMERINLVHRTSQKISNGAHGNTAGIHGSLCPSSLGSIFTSVDVFGEKGVDLGAGNGIVLAAALASGVGPISSALSWSKEMNIDAGLLGGLLAVIRCTS